MNQNFIASFVNYSKENLNFTNDQLEKMEYSFTVIITELEKIVMLFLIFSFFHKALELIIAMVTLMLIRPYTGGLHFKKFFSCFAFSLMVFSITIFGLTHITISYTALVFIYIASTMSFIILAPISSKTRPKYSKSKRMTFKFIAIFMTTLFFVAYIILHKEYPYFNQSIWIIALQSIQLIIAKGVRSYEKNHDKKSNQCCI